MILENVAIEWVKVVPSQPDMGFDGNTPQWQVTVVLRDKAQANDLKKQGFNVKLGEDDEGVKYTLQLKKMAKKKDGTDEKPVPVVGPDLMPIEDVGAIGNGSIANVKIRTFEYNYNGRQGVGVRLASMQIVKLVKFESKNDDAAGFKVIEQANDTTADEEDLY